MKRPLIANRFGVAVLALSLGAGGIAACEDDEGGPLVKDAAPDAVAPKPDAGTDTATPADTGAPDAAAGLSLYERLGGKAGLETFVKSVVETKVLTDADLKTFFFNQVAMPIPAGHPSATQIVVCFGRFVGAALTADTYPGAPVNDPANTNTPNFTCRDMVASHKGAGTMLNIGSGNFDKFIGHIATSLMPLVKPTATKAGEITQGEFDALAAALIGQKAAITTTGAPSTGPFVPVLYDRLGGKAGLESFVKTVVETKVLTDADLKTFFFNQVATPIPAGHPSATQIVVCFGRFVGAALMADTYPGAPVSDPANTNTPSFTCRDMVASHKGAGTMLNIGSANFDKFIGHIATSLMPLVKPTATKAGEITQGEFDALAAALNGQKAAITTTGAPTSGPFVPVLYDRLGGKAGLEAFVKGVVENRILADADLKTFFFNQVASPIPAGHPSAKQITVCFGRFVGAALMADAYPGAAVNDPANTNTPNFTCRDMVASHKSASTMLHIGSGTFDKFIGFIAMDLMPLVKPTATKAGEITQAEFNALAAALNAQKDAVTTAGAAAVAGPFPN